MAFEMTIGYHRTMDAIANSNKFVLKVYESIIYKSDLEGRYSELMLVIGMYIAVASLCCNLAMGADLLSGLINRKLWFPCKFSSVNALSLSVIAVAMKLPVDLSGNMPGHADQDAKLGSMVFMCTMLANSLPCLAIMGSTELFTNITALGVLVITLAVNVCIQISTGVVGTIPNDKVIQTLIAEGEISQPDELTVIPDLLYTTLAAIYVALLLLLLIIYACSFLAILRSKEIIESKYQQAHKAASKDVHQTVEKLQEHVSNYWITAGSGSPQFILACSATSAASGVICTLTLILHTLTVAWTIPELNALSYNSDYKWSTLVILIVQYVGVILGTVAPLIRCFASLRFKLSFESISNHFKVFKVEKYWTHKLYDWKYGSISLSFRSHTLKVFVVGVRKYDNTDHLDCWSLAVVTLTTIAATLPNIKKVEVKSLLKSVREGLQYITLVEENLKVSDDYESIQKAAKTMWEEVDLHDKWLGIKLKDIASQENTTLQIVQLFLEKAESKIKEGVQRTNIEGPDGYSAHIYIGAKSMSRIAQTIIDDKQSHNKLFEELSSRIADILAACLTNLPEIITMQAHTSVIEKRKASVKAAAQLLGVTKEIIKTLQDPSRHVPHMSSDDLLFINKWRAHFRDPESYPFLKY
ncbi:uncharacterized protein LOC143632316 [Bidens hawaiensis]|uniref:uncharacterized protein LOC143632316 n=1 Tax=Bidens hawaiensis TaxID=980011 RepID=UPI00404A3CA0